MSLLKKILNYSFWLLVGNSIGRLAMFLTNIFAARLLPQEVFGQFTMIRSTVNMLSSIVGGTLSPAATKNVAETLHQDKRKIPLLLSAFFFVNLTIMLIIILFILFFTEWLVQTYFIATAEMVGALYIGAFLFLVTTLTSLVQSMLIGFEKYKKMASIGIAVSTISIPIIFILIHYFAMYGALIGVAFYFLFDFILKFRFLISLVMVKKISFEFSDIIKESKKIISFSLPIFISIILTSVSFWYARVILVNSSHSFIDIAIFDASYQWLTVIMILTGATTSVALPMLSKALISSKSNEKNNVFKINLLVNTILSFGMAIIFFLLSKQIMSVYGSNYLVGAKTLQILSFVSILFTLSSLFNKYMISHHKVWIILINSLISVCSLFTVLFLNLNLKNIALAWALVAFYATSTIVYYLYYILLQRKNSSKDII